MLELIRTGMTTLFRIADRFAHPGAATANLALHGELLRPDNQFMIFFAGKNLPQQIHSKLVTNTLVVSSPQIAKKQYPPI
jgi:hypothetical protein